MRYAIYALVTLIALSASDASAQIAWEGKLRDAHAKAKQQNKLMLLHFYSDNCVWCEKLEAKDGAFRNASVADAINRDFVPVKIHAGENSNIAKMFKVTKYPTDVIVTSDGKALSHQVSPQRAGQYVAMLSGARVAFAKSRTSLASAKLPPQATGPVAANPNPAPQMNAAPQINVPPATTQVSNAHSLPAQIPAPHAVSSRAISPDAAAVPEVGKVAAKPVSAPAQTNQFMLPSARAASARAASARAASAPAASDRVSIARSDVAASGTVNASLAAAKSKPVSEPSAALLPPEKVADSTDADIKPELAIEGYCPVSVVQKGEWLEGKSEFGVIHLGKLYLFADKASKEAFLADPVPFTPMLNEIDIVRFFEEKKIVPGRREWGVIDPIHNRMFFFADEAAMIHFENSFERYLDAAIEVMDQAIADANPGV